MKLKDANTPGGCQNLVTVATPQSICLLLVIVQKSDYVGSSGMGN